MARRIRLLIPMLAGYGLFTGCVREMLYPISTPDDKYGYIDHKGRMVIEPTRCNVSEFKNGMGIIDATDRSDDLQRSFNKPDIYFINSKGQRIITLDLPHSFTSPFLAHTHFSEGKIRVEPGFFSAARGVQFYGTDGKLSFTNYYQNATDFSCGLAAVKLNGKYGYINGKGALVISNSFDNAWNFFTKNKAIVELNGKWGVINRNGDFVLPPQYGFLWPSTGSYLLAQNAEKTSWGLIDIYGRQADTNSFKNASRFVNGFAVVENPETHKLYFINDKGKRITSFSFDEFLHFSEGFAGIEINGKWGFINHTGKIIVEPQYEDIIGFSEGLAGVKLNEKWGFINRSGKVIIPFQFCVAESFKGGLAKVETENEYGYINTKGRYVWKMAYDESNSNGE